VGTSGVPLRINNRGQILFSGGILTNNVFQPLSANGGFLAFTDSGEVLEEDQADLYQNWFVVPGSATPVRGGCGGGRYSFATDMNSLGSVVGYGEAGAGSGKTQQCIWRRGAPPIDLQQTFGAGFGSATVLNNLDWALGTFTFRSGVHFVLVANGEMFALSALGDADFAAWSIQSVIAINDMGQILATAVDPVSHLTMPVILDPGSSGP
jgi:hypothetical protein